MGICFDSAATIAAGVRNGEYEVVDVVETTLDRIDERGAETNAYITVTASAARERAREVQAQLDEGAELPLAGVPVAIKDLSETKAGVPNTKGLEPLADNIAEETSVTVRRLEAAGAIVVGTTNTPELGHRVRTDNRLQGPTSTPFDTAYNAGGSSGGSAAALADGLCVLATGSDVGGSLRNPAACCGVVALKPSHGLVPRGNRVNGFRGHTPIGVLGPMARDVESLGILLEVLAGKHSVDPLSVPQPDSYDEPDGSVVDSLRLAYSPDLDCFAVDPSVRNAVRSTLSSLEAAGATVETVSLETPAYGELTHAYTTTVTTFFATAVAELEASLGVDLLEAHDAEVPPELRTLVSMGRSHDINTYTGTELPRTELFHAIEPVCKEYDALVCPSLATPPLTHDEPFPQEIDGQSTGGLPTDWTMAWPFNLTGHPVVNVPAGTVDGLPVGMQVVGETFSEATLLDIAAAVEAVEPWSYPNA